MAGTKAAGQGVRPETGILPTERLGPKESRHPTPTRRALVVTSDDEILHLCQQALKGTQYAVEHVESAHAIEFTQTLQISLLLIDQPPKDEDTIELLRRVKTMSPETAIVLLIDDISVDDLIAAMRCGLVDCLRKPFTLERLRQITLKATQIDSANREYAILKAFSPLFEVSNDLNSSLDLDDVLSSTARHASHLTGAHASHIVLFDPHSQHLVFRAGHGDRERWERGHRRIVDGPALEAISNNRCLSIPDLHTGTCAECLTCAQRNGLCSSIWVPLSVGDRSIGAVIVCSKIRYSWSPEEIDVLRALGNYAATAMERARLYQETKRALDKLDMLYNINRAVGSSFELDEVIDAILRIEAVLPYDSASVFVLDERHNVVRMHASRNLDAELQAVTMFKVGEGIVGWVAANAQSLSVPNTALDDRYEPRGVVDNPRSILAVPLRAGGKVLAVLNLTRYRVSAFTEEEARLAELIASQAAQAMRNAQLYQNACYLLEEESALHSLAKIINSSSSPEELLNQVAPLVAEALRAESCVICLTNPAVNRLFLARSVGVSDRYADQIAETVDEWPIHRKTLSSVEPVSEVIRRESHPQRRESLLLGSWNGVVSVLSAPLSAHQRTLGVVTVARRTTSGQFLPRDKDLLANISSQISVGIEELRLRVHDMLTVYELSQFSGTTLNLEEIYRRILNKMEPLFDSESLCLLLFNESERKFEVESALGTSRDRWSNLEHLDAESLAERLSNARQPLVFASMDVTNQLVPWPARGRLSPILMAPMVVEGSLIGALVIRVRGNELPSEDRRMLLASLAVQAALVIRNAHLYAASQELAIGEERNRIAREFHDGVAQNLAHLLHKVQLINRLLDIDMGRAKMEIERGRKILEESIRELRRCIYALGPVHLEGTGIVQALERIVNDFAEQNDLEVSLDLDPISNLPSRIEAAVFRVVQEALNNIRKHAQASRFGVLLRMTEDYLHLVIEDDGKGFDCDTAPADGISHFGIPQMKERARELGGYLEIRSSQGKGTTIELWVPLACRSRP